MHVRRANTLPSQEEWKTITLLENRSTDPAFNMALDEYVCRNMDPSRSYFWIYRMQPSVIVGRNQNTIEEVNLPYVEQHGVTVVRRMSGGGAVYDDLGNVIFSFVVPTPSDQVDNYARLTEPVLAALHRLGAEAERSGRNDLTIGGRKFCGNAVYVAGGRMLHHGSILYDTNLDEVQRTLSVAKDKIESHGVKSVRSRVTNVRPHLPGQLSWEMFAEALTEEVGRFSGGLTAAHRLTDEQEAAVRRLRDRKYATWEWTYGESPPSTVRVRRRFPSGTIDLRLSVEGGCIIGLKVFGDFFGNRDVAEWEETLRGAPFDRQKISRRLAAQPISDYFWGLTANDILSVLFETEPARTDS